MVLSLVGGSCGLVMLQIWMVKGGCGQVQLNFFVYSCFGELLYLQLELFTCNWSLFTYNWFFVTYSGVAYSEHLNEL